MGRGLLYWTLASAVALGLSVDGAAAKEATPPARKLVPQGGMWQSIPYADHEKKRGEPAAKPAPAKPVRAAVVAPKAAPKPLRNPVAASTPDEPPRTGAAAKTRELQRRIDALSPGTKLGEPIHDPQNPHWRRARPGATGPDGRDLAMPFDETGRNGFIARGYHTDPNWENPRGTLGATFGVRTKF